MTSPDGAVTLAFNGEIYNFRQLRQELHRPGLRLPHGRATPRCCWPCTSATAWQMLARLEGMFAFAIYDGAAAAAPPGARPPGREAAVVRPRAAGRASSSPARPRPCWSIPAWTAPSGRESVLAYLTLGYIPAPQSIWRGLRKLPPGHVATFGDGADGEPRRVVAAAQRDARRSARADAVARLRRPAGRRGRPSGSWPTCRWARCCRGGVDSSVVAALMCQAAGDPAAVKTFSVGFEEGPSTSGPSPAAWPRTWAPTHREYLVRPTRPRCWTRWSASTTSRSATPAPCRRTCSARPCAAK